jgi:hypothetical protein
MVTLIFISLKEVTNPNLMIKTKLYALKSVDDTTFSLEVENKEEAAISNINSSKNKSQSSTYPTNSNDSLDSNQPEMTNFKSKRKMFEFNYEIRFNSKEIK